MEIVLVFQKQNCKEDERKFLNLNLIAWDDKGRSIGMFNDPPGYTFRYFYNCEPYIFIVIRLEEIDIVFFDFLKYAINVS